MAKVELRSGGAIEMSLEQVNLFELSIEDRQFVFDLIDRLRGYGQPAVGIVIEGSGGSKAVTPWPPTAESPTEPPGDAKQPSPRNEPAEETKAPITNPAAPDPVIGKQLVHVEPEDTPRVAMPAGSAQSRKQAVLDYLTRRGRAASAEEIRNHLSGLGFTGLLPKDVRNSLSYLKQTGEIRSTERGMYIAVAVLPAKPPAPASPTSTEPAPPDDAEEEHGEQPPAGTLGKLLEEIRASKQEPAISPDATAAERPKPFVPEPPSFRPDVEAERAAKEIDQLEASSGQAADALPLASGGPCRWHGGCNAASERLVPSYYGGRLTSMYEMCRQHALKKIFADRLTPARAEAFATEQAAGRAVV